jgi:glutathione S-transferase
MALTLYGAARSRASIVRWYLEEKGIPYQWQLLDLAAAENRQEPFTRINPFGKVPALVDSSLQDPAGQPLALFESGAILLHVADVHGQEFPRAQERALAAQWVLWANASFGPAMLAAAQRPEELGRLLQVLNGLLVPGQPLVAGTPGGWGAADCAVHAYLAYLPMFCPTVDLSPYPQVQATIAASQARPAYRTVMGLA